jgi:hypothetical protein
MGSDRVPSRLELARCGAPIVVASLLVVGGVLWFAWRTWPTLVPPAELAISVGRSGQALQELAPGEEVLAAGAPGTTVDLALRIVSTQAGTLHISRTAPLLRSTTRINVLGGETVTFVRGARRSTETMPMVDLGRVEANTPTVVDLIVGIPPYAVSGTYDSLFMPTVETSGTTDFEALRIPLRIEVQ